MIQIIQRDSIGVGGSGRLCASHLSLKRIEWFTCPGFPDADRALHALYPQSMNTGNRKGGSNMATLLRTIRLVVIAVAAMALVAPAAQARPIGVPAPSMHTHTAVRTSILKDKLQLPPPVIKTSVSRAPAIVASESGFSWTDAVIGAAFATILIGLGISGMQMNHRRTAHV
jgi:hypothetical protein